MNKPQPIGLEHYVKDGVFIRNPIMNLKEIDGEGAEVGSPTNCGGARALKRRLSELFGTKVDRPYLKARVLRFTIRSIDQRFGCSTPTNLVAAAYHFDASGGHVGEISEIELPLRGIKGKPGSHEKYPEKKNKRMRKYNEDVDSGERTPVPNTRSWV